MSGRKNIPSPGGILPNNAIFEQVQIGKSNQYAIKEGDKTRIEPMLSVGEHVLYQPLEMPPWKLPGKPLDYETVEKLWQEIRQFIYEHLDVEIDALYDVLTGWVIVTWVTERFDSVGYLHFHGPRNSGKTRGLDILNYLCYRPLLSPSVTGPAVFRALDEYHPTFLLDEFEMYEKIKESKAEVIGVVNAGYRRGQVVLRVQMRDGAGFLRGFSVFGPKALSSIEELPDALRSRCIKLPMTKAYRKIRILIDKETAEELRSKLLQYRFDHLGDAPPEGNPIDLPDGRLIEMYYPLESVAPTDEIKKVILDHAKSQYNASVEQDRATIEATIFSMIIDMLEQQIRFQIPQADIRERFNQDVTNPKEGMGNRRLGGILERLNLSNRTITVAGKRRKAIVVDPDVLDRRKHRYYLVEELERVSRIIESVRSASKSTTLPTLLNMEGMPQVDAGTKPPTQVGNIPKIDKVDNLDKIATRARSARNCSNCGDPLNAEVGEFMDKTTNRLYCRSCFTVMRDQGLIDSGVARDTKP